MLPKDLQKLVEDTVMASKLDAAEADDLRRELITHCEDQLEDLIIQGTVESKAIPYIIKQFGETATIGEALYMVHQRYERIPLIGPILYYAPFRQAVVMCAQHIVLLVSLFFLSVKPVVTPEAGEIVWWYIVIVLGIFCATALLQGMWLYFKCTARLETLLLSYMPFVIIVITLQVNEIAEDYFLRLPPSEFNIERGLFLLILLIPHCIGVIFGLASGLLLHKLKQRYEHSPTR